MSTKSTARVWSKLARVNAGDLTFTAVTALVFVLIVGPMSDIHNRERTWLWSHDHDDADGYTNELYTYAHGLVVSKIRFTPGGVLIALTISAGLTLLVAMFTWGSARVAHLVKFAHDNSLFQMWSSVLQMLLVVSAAYFAGLRDAWNIALIGILVLLANYLNQCTRSQTDDWQPFVHIPAALVQFTAWIVVIVSSAYYYKAIHNRAGDEDSAQRDWYDNDQAILVIAACTTVASLMILKAAICTAIIYQNRSKTYNAVTNKTVDYSSIDGMWRASNLTTLCRVGALVWGATLLCTSVEAGLDTTNHWAPASWRLGNSQMKPIVNEPVELSWVFFTMALVNFLFFTSMSFESLGGWSRVVRNAHAHGSIGIYGCLFAFNIAAMFLVVSTLSGGNDIIGLVILVGVIFASTLYASKLRRIDHIGDRNNEVGIFIGLLGLSAMATAAIRTFDEKNIMNTHSTALSNDDFESRKTAIYIAYFVVFAMYYCTTTSLAGFRNIIDLYDDKKTVTRQSAVDQANAVFHLTRTNIVVMASFVLVAMYGNLLLTFKSAQSLADFVESNTVY